MESFIHLIFTGIAGPLPVLAAAIVVGVLFFAIATGAAGRAALYVEERRHALLPTPAAVRHEEPGA